MKRRLQPHLASTGKRALVAVVLAIGATLASAGYAPGWYYRPGIPDYDQQRSGLGGNGANFCVPTSYADILKYMAAAGMTNEDSTYGNSYSAITDFIDRLADEMGTSSTSGTSPHTAFTSMTSWINSHTSTWVINNFYGPNWSWGQKTVRNAIALGAINRIGFGRYHNNGNGSWDRGTGHSQVLSGYDFTGDPNVFILRNPATDGDLGGQSSFLDEGQQTRNITLTTTDYGRVTHCLCSLWEGDNGQHSYRKVFDSMHLIYPTWAGWLNTGVSSGPVLSPKPVPGHVAASLPSFKTILPWQFEGEGQVADNFEFTPDGEVLDWVYDVGQPAIVYLTKTGKVYYMNFVTGDHFLIANRPGARRVAVGGTTLDIYLLMSANTGDLLAKIERDDLTLDEGQVSPGTSPRIKLVRLPAKGVEIDIDPQTNGIAVLAAAQDKMWSFSEDLLLVQTVLLPQLGGSGDVVFRIDPTNREILRARRGDHQFLAFELVGTRGPRISPTFPDGIESMELGMNGMVMVQDGGVLKTFDHSGLEVTCQLTGLVVGGPTKLPRSHFAAKASDMVGPGWDDVIDP